MVPDVIRDHDGTKEWCGKVGPAVEGIETTTRAQATPGWRNGAALADMA